MSSLAGSPAPVHRPLFLFGEGHDELELSVLAAAVRLEAIDPSGAPGLRAAAAATTSATETDPHDLAAAAVARLAVARSGASASEREPRTIAELASAELRAAGRSPQRAATLASALGGLNHLAFGPTPFVQTYAVDLGPLLLLPLPDEGLVAAAEAARGTQVAIVAELLAARPELDLARLTFDEAWNLLLDVPARAVDAATRERLFFSLLQSRDLLIAAHQLLAAPGFDLARRAHLGELLDRDHLQRHAALCHPAPRMVALRAALLAEGAIAAWRSGGQLAALAPLKSAPSASGAAAVSVAPARSA